jgi:UDP-N-acetylglucosamine--N-acetylmuramyl-(pentapeptide) pyrophosphoryl-undecaprenol N-acetylglucosamine transferase
MRIIITGGHLTPAYGFSKEALKNNAKVLMVGAAGQNSVEAAEMKKVDCGYKTIKAVKFDRNNKLSSILKFPSIVIPLFQAMHILRSWKPDCVVTFGSFNAVPVAIAAKMLGVPLVIHEQTRSIGLANQIIAPFAKKIALSYESSKGYFKQDGILIGNILRDEIWNPPTQPPFTIPTGLPIVYITGGNQGSIRIVNEIKKILPELVSKYQVILQYGKQYPWGQGLPPTPIISKSWFSASETAWILHHAHVVISRGGANTVAEIMIAGVPSIIIPLPNTSQNEQFRNAQLIANAGAGIMIEQRLLNSSSLLVAIAALENTHKNLTENAQTLTNLQHKDAATQLYSIVLNAVNKN